MFTIDQIARFCICFGLIFQGLPGTGRCQVTYFHQDFGKTASLVNPQPDTGQFSHIILTAPQLSYHKFHKGFMELARTRQDSATGGIIRVMRATPFEPNPETLIVQLSLSAEAIQSVAANAVYFYVGENFDPANNSFPGNQLMFAKCALNFNESGFAVKDLATQQISDTIMSKQKATITWALNNGTENLEYISPVGKQTLAPRCYDLWVNEKPVHLGSPGYPGGLPFSATKLSNFEIRFRNGLGKLRMHSILIRSAEPESSHLQNIVTPNPVTGTSFFIHGNEILSETVRLYDAEGRHFPIEASSSGAGCRVEFNKLPSGIYIVRYSTTGQRQHTARFLID